jgi:acyl-CoA synthetase (AMP-forming)/AMP-acid ligase II
MICAGLDVRAALVHAADRALLYNPSGGVRTGSQIVENVERVVGALLSNRLMGGKIGLWYRNSLSAVEAFLAVEWIGGTRVPVDPHAPPAEAEEIFEAAGVDAVLADRTLGTMLTRQVLIHDDDAPLIGPTAWPQAAVHPDKTLLLYPRAVNSGKLCGIPVSYANWRATMRVNIGLYRGDHYGPWLGDQECFLAVQQIMHGTGFVGTFPFLEMGVPQVLASSFDAGQTLEAIDRHRITATVLVPAMMSRLVDAASQRPGTASSLRHLIYGGAPVAAEEMQRTMQRFGPILSQGYGRIEGGWPISILGIKEHRSILAGDGSLAGSCGRPIADVWTKLRSSAGEATNLGELCVASEMAVKEFSDPNGWCSLGDIMRMDADGYMFHQGRLDRMINTGYHIYPSEVEEAIKRVSGVAAVRVAGDENPERGTVVVADLVLTEGAIPEDVTARVKQELAARLAKYKIPRELRIVHYLPE